jgi:hypothetical protein
MEAHHTSPAGRLVHYDGVRRRLWVAGQRCHHGAGGAIAAALGLTGLASHLAAPGTTVALAVTGGVLMAHDWKDRAIWFERGAGSQG